MKMTEDQANAVFDILVADCAAIERERDSFVYHHTARNCSEYRCCWALGFGGKFRSKRFQVDGYPEDMNPKRRKICNKVNAELTALKRSWEIEKCLD